MMRTYTVTGLVDEENGDLYVAAVQAGRHDPGETAEKTTIAGFGNLFRFTGYFEADSFDEAERIAVDVTKHYADDDAVQWAPGGGRRFRSVETIQTDKI